MALFGGSWFEDEDDDDDYGLSFGSLAEDMRDRQRERKRRERDAELGIEDDRPMHLRGD